MELAFQEREDLPAATPSSLLPHSHSPEPTREQMDKEQDQPGTGLGGLEELKDKSLYRTQTEEDNP
jgi:hypothetical protein